MADGSAGPPPLGVLLDDRRVALGLAAAVAAGVVGLLCTIGVMLLLAATIDAVFLDGEELGEVAGLLVAAVGLLVIRGGCALASEVSADRASARLRTRERDRLVAHLFRAGPGGLADQRVGDVASTVGAGIEALHDYATRFVPAAALGVIGPVVVLVAIALLDPWSTPVLLFTGPMLVLLLAVIGGRTRALTRRRFDELGWLSSFYLDMIRGLATLKAFRRSSEGGDTIEAVSRRYGDATMDVLRTAFQTSLVTEWAATAATALVAVQVSFRMIESDLPFGTALAVLVLTPEFFVPFRRLALEYHSGQAGRAALERIEELTDASTPEPPRPDPTPPPPTPPRASASSAPHRSTRPGAPAIELVGVTFTYPGSTRPALDRLDLHLDAAATVALVGPSGAGKTTVARLVMRFVEPTAGRILVDGRPITDVESATWRRGVAWVPQDPALIAGTIADNIRLGAPDAPLDAVRAAADAARATGFVEQLPDGFDTVLGEEGLRLSGGQRQRLAIARALLRDAPVVVLDEPTAHLDDTTEAEVLAAIAELLGGRTALVIAHRPQTIAAADRVVTLVEGRPIDPAVGST